MQKERASKKQQELLSFVDGFIKGNGYGPSYREIMRALGYKSVSTVAIHIDSLIAKGYLARRDNSARSLEVVTTRTEGPSDTLTDGIEQLLEKKVAALELTDDDREAMKRTLTLLGFNKVAQSIENRNNENTKDTDS